MAEKKEGFGAAAAQQSNKKPPVLFETPDYRVVPGSLPPDKDTNPDSPFLFRYVIQHKTHGVVYGTAAGFGQAIAAAVQAQIELTNATEAAESFAARSYTLDKKGSTGGVDIPDFTGRRQ